MPPHLPKIALTSLITLLGLTATPTPSIFPVPFSAPTALAQTPEARKAEAERLLAQGSEKYSASQFRAALESWEQALTIYRELNNRSGEAASLGGLGNAYHALGQYQKAIDFYQQWLVLSREIGDRLGESSSLAGLGNTYNYLGQYQKAIEFCQQASVIAREINYRIGEGIAANNLGNAYRDLGQYQKAIEFYQQSLTIAKEIGNRSGEAVSLQNQGTAYFYLGQYQKAIEFYQQSLDIAQEIGESLREAESLGGLGIAYRNLGQYQKAIEFHQQGLALSREISDRHGEGRALTNLGAAYYSLGNFAQAIEYQQQSLVIARETGDRITEAKTLNNLGVGYYSLGNYAQAIDYHRQYLVIAREIGDLDGEGYALNGLGLALFYSGDLKQAEKIFRDAIAARESLRARLGSDDANKVSIADRDIGIAPYRNLQQVLIAQNNPLAALEIAERGRARAFAELLAQRFSSVGTQGTASQQLNIEPPTIQKIQQIASQQNATLVQYAIVYDQLYIWVIPPTGEIAFRSVNLATMDSSLADTAQGTNIAAATGSIRGGESQDDTALASFVRGTRQDVEASQPERVANSPIAANRDSAPSRFKNRRLRQSYELLIEPIADLLPTNPESHVIFIPQGELFLIPFPALQDEAGKYLIEKHTILTAPSIQALDLTRQARQNLSQPATSNLLVVGNPTMPTLQLNPNEPPKPLAPLPGAEQEARAIAQLLNTQALIGSAATESVIVQQLPQARTIHLATHGLLDEIKSLNLEIPGAIALAPGNSQDGLLTSEEILKLKLNAELVVLSACDTGQGKITGDGVIGLSRAFISAGVPSVVVSLWAVPDDSTANLMTEFYRQMQQNPDKAQALRNAMLTTLQQHPDPREWAAFTLIGESK